MPNNNSLENLKIASKEKNLVNLLNKSINRTDQTSKNQIKDLLSIEQLIAPFNHLSEANKSSSCELVAKIKSNEHFLTNLYSLSAKELVQIKQLITGTNFCSTLLSYLN